MTLCVSATSWHGRAFSYYKLLTLSARKPMWARIQSPMLAILTVKVCILQRFVNCYSSNDT